MLVEMAAILPKGYPVYVTFDSWYASAKLIKFCRRQGWHVICALKSNRLLNGISVKQHDQAHKHRRYTRVRVRAADQSYAVRYFTRSARAYRQHSGGSLRDHFKTAPGFSLPEVLLVY